MAIGMFDSLASVASQPLGVWDVVPADQVAGVIVAAAAAMAAGVGARVSAVTGAGRIAGSQQDSNAVLLGQTAGIGANGGACANPLLAGAADLSASIHVLQGVGKTDKQAPAATLQPLIVELGKSSKGVDAARPWLGEDSAAGRALSAHSDDTAMCSNIGAGAGANSSSVGDLTTLDGLPGPCGNSDTCGSCPPSAASSPVGRGRHGAVGASCAQHTQDGVLCCTRYAAAVAAESTFSACEHGLLSSARGVGMDGVAVDACPPRLPLLIVHAASSSTYPLTLMEGWNYNLDFFDAHPPPFRCEQGNCVSHTCTMRMHCLLSLPLTITLATYAGLRLAPFRACRQHSSQTRRM